MDTIVTPVTVITLDSTRIVHSIKADLVARYFPPVVRLVQYDQSLPVIAVSLMQNGQTYTLPSGAAANIRVHKPDATYVYNPALGCDSTRNIVYFEVTQAMAAANGDGLAIVEIVVNGDIAGTSLITLHFEENPVPEDAIESSDEWETIYELGERIIASTVTPVSTAAGMTDHNVVYLYTGTESGWNQGHMYYYNGTTWVDAGIAVTDTTLSVAGLAADAKKTGDEIADLKDGLTAVESDVTDLKEEINDFSLVRVSNNLLNPKLFNINKTVQWNTGEIKDNDNYVCWTWIPVTAGKHIYFSRGNKTGQAPAAACYYDNDKTYKGFLSMDATNGVIVPNNAAYICLTLTKTSYNNFASTWMLQYDGITEYRKYFDPYTIIPNRNSDFVLSIAHQGYNKVAPIQTMPAYKAAYKYGFNIIECDVIGTSDGNIICCHNDTVYADDNNKVIRQDLMSAQSPYVTPIVIEQTTLSTLQTYSWGAWFSDDYSNVTVLTFEDLLAFAKHNNLCIMVDHAYHVATNPALFEKFKALVDKYGMRDKCYITSVGDGIADWNPKAKVLYGTTTYSGPTDMQQLLTYIQNHPDVEPWIVMPYQQIDASKGTEIHAYGINIMVYTIDDMETMYNISNYVDAIVSNSYMVSDAIMVYDA